MSEPVQAGTRSGASTAVPEEVARFNSIAHQWWDPHGQFRPLHRLNPVRLSFIRGVLCRHFGRDPTASRPLETLSGLDVGCGGGLATEPLARFGASMTGVDASALAVQIADAHAKSQGLTIHYQWALPEELADWTSRYDFVVALEVIEHVGDLAGFFEATARLIRPGGAMIVATLNRTLQSLALAKIGAEYVLRWLPVGTHDWRKFVRPAELAQLMRRHGLVPKEMQGMRYNPLTTHWSLARDLTVNYIAYAAKAGG